MMTIEVGVVLLVSKGRQLNAESLLKWANI